MLAIKIRAAAAVKVTLVGLEILILSYVCIEVTLRGDAHGIGYSNWAKGRDPSGSWVQYPNPAAPLIPRHAR